MPLDDVSSGCLQISARNITTTLFRTQLRFKELTIFRSDTRLSRTERMSAPISQRSVNWGENSSHSFARELHNPKISKRIMFQTGGTRRSPGKIFGRQTDFGLANAKVRIYEASASRICYLRENLWCNKNEI